MLQADLVASRCGDLSKPFKGSCPSKADGKSKITLIVQWCWYSRGAHVWARPILFRVQYDLGWAWINNLGPFSIWARFGISDKSPKIGPTPTN